MTRPPGFEQGAADTARSKHAPLAFHTMMYQLIHGLPQQLNEGAKMRRGMLRQVRRRGR